MFYQELLWSRQLFLVQQLPVRCLAGLSFHLVGSKLPALFLRHKNRKGVVHAYVVMH